MFSSLHPQSQYTFRALPVLVIGLLALLGGLLALALPETLNHMLVDTIQEAENLGRPQVAPPSLQCPNGTTGGAPGVEEYLLQGPIKKETFI